MQAKPPKNAVLQLSYVLVFGLSPCHIYLIQMGLFFMPVAQKCVCQSEGFSHFALVVPNAKVWWCVVINNSSAPNAEPVVERAQ